MSNEAIKSSSRLEASKTQAGGRYRVTIIEEGLGNFGDCFYYTKQAVESAKEPYEGAQAFADHPDKIEAQILPERSVRRLCGHYENCEVVQEDGRSKLKADLVTIPGTKFDWIRDLLDHDIEYGKKYEESFVGISINASGDATDTPIDDMLKSKDVPDVCKPKLEHAKSLGVTEVRVTGIIADAVSADIVTKAGAGGGIEKRLESERIKMATKKKENDGALPAKKDGGDDEGKLKSALDKHMGEGKHGEAEAEAAKLASEAYEAMGHSKEEAMEMGAKHVAAAKKMGEKKKEDGSDGAADGGNAAPIAKDAKKDPDDVVPHKPAPQEAGSKAELAKLEGRLSMIEKENAALKLNQHISTKIKESKISSKDEAKVRKLLEGVETVKSADVIMSAFLEGAKNHEGVYTNAEKTTLRESSEGGEAISFAEFAQQ
jgi:hypothetical protein